MLSLKANKKLIQDKLASTTGKVVLLKDLSNISSRMKTGDTRNDICESIRRLTEDYGKCVEKHGKGLGTRLLSIISFLPYPPTYNLGLEGSVTHRHSPPSQQPGASLGSVYQNLVSYMYMYIANFLINLLKPIPQSPSS